VISASRPTSRAFDNCFENSDGDEVSAILVRRADKNTKLRDNLWRYLNKDIAMQAAARLRHVPTRQMPNAARQSRARARRHIDQANNRGDHAMTKTYRAEFFTDADHAVRNFEAGTPEEALQLARRFYDDDVGELDFRSYDDSAGLDRIQIWDNIGGTLAYWESDDYRLRNAAPQLLAALKWIIEYIQDHPEWNDKYFCEKGEALAETAWFVQASATIAKAESGDHHAA
jgi:hypothetical protein